MQSTSSAVVRCQKALSAVLAIAFVLSSSNVFALSTDQFAVKVSATVQRSPPRITLNWAADGGASGYTICRKSPGSTDWGAATNIGNTNSYNDTGVSVGTQYEYRIQKSGQATGYGYICAAIEASLIERRGKVILLVDSTYAGSLTHELNTLAQDLVGDGWEVLRRDVPRSTDVVGVKNIVRNDYNSDPGNVKAIYVFGHVAVPYSGSRAFDGHSNHNGAWPADCFYGEMNGIWTDSSVNAQNNMYQESNNRPGDGKYDQSTLPSDVEVGVGRVDLINMSKFGSSDTELLRNYLNKAHRYKHKQMNLQRRGLICDTFGVFGSESFAATGYRNFPPDYGASNVQSVGPNGFVNALNGGSYQWSYGCGAGSNETCSGVADTAAFANNDMQTNFVAMFGSWFGDWNQPNNLLRAPLASRSYILANVWAGRPHWQFHHMAMGEPMAYSTKLTQNNNGLYVTGSSPRGIHIALMGDPTLRLHAVTPPSGVSVTSGVVRWTASSDSVVGYHVYKASSSAGPFSRLNGSLVSGTSYTDTTNGSGVYMVRAVKLEVAGSGSYFNASQGIFSNGSGGGTPPPPPGNGTGLTGEYFDNADFTNLKLTRVDPVVNFNWGAGSPSSSVGNDLFSARWTGQVEPQKTETYTFYTQSDDGARVWVNNQLIINKWANQAVTEISGTMSLTAGQKYSIKVEYYDNVYDATMRLLWSSPSIAKNMIPKEQLYPASVTPPPGSGDGLSATYFDNTDFTSPKVTRVDATVNFDWGHSAPVSGVANDSFSVRWQGLVQPAKSETYTFYTQSDDGVRLWVNNQLIINKWLNQAVTENSATITLAAGQKYSIKLEYYDNLYAAVSKLYWSSPTTAKQIVPQAALFSNTSAAIAEAISEDDSETAGAAAAATQAVKPPEAPEGDF